MARKKEIGRDRILEVAYKLAIKGGLENLTARNIAKAGDFSTQPIYLEFSNMDDLRQQVLNQISAELSRKTLQRSYTGKPLIDLDLSYIEFAKTHVAFFRAMFVYGKFGSEIITKNLMQLGVSKFKEQYPDAEFSEKRILHIIISNWISTTGIAALVVNQIASFNQSQIVDIIESQIKDAMVNDHLETADENPLFNMSNVK
ncbi:MAG: TetR/AcrR family transcriptional regulator [Lactobacillus sp.]|nr:TetR/AcrR family transcriptional regulator [Lactobacillus sp.]MDN6053000.1 TetR/AcrR family transcriptional regulator [Lactobacillus sp.]